MYIRNDSTFLLNQKYSLKLDGIGVAYPEVKGKEYRLLLPAGEDQIFILKRLGQKCTFNSSVQTKAEKVDAAGQQKRYQRPSSTRIPHSDDSD